MTFIVLAGLQNQCYSVTDCLLMHDALPSYRNGVLPLNLRQGCLQKNSPKNISQKVSSICHVLQCYALQYCTLCLIDCNCWGGGATWWNVATSIEVWQFRINVFSYNNNFIWTIIQFWCHLLASWIWYYGREVEFQDNQSVMGSKSKRSPSVFL